MQSEKISASFGSGEMFMSVPDLCANTVWCAVNVKSRKMAQIKTDCFTACCIFRRLSFTATNLMRIALMSLKGENVAKRFATLVTLILPFCSPALVHLEMFAQIVLENINVL